MLRTIAAEFSLLGRPGELELTSLDLRAQLNRVVGSVLETATTDTGGQASLSVDIAGQEPPPVLGHAESVLKILGNLLQNSLDAVRAVSPCRSRWTGGTMPIR